MNGACPHTAPALPAHVATSYERLREQAVCSGVAWDRDGLAVLAHRGVAAWLGVLAALPAAPASADMARSRGPLPTDVETCAVDILIAMVRPHMAGQPA